METKGGEEHSNPAKLLTRRETKADKGRLEPRNPATIIRMSAILNEFRTPTVDGLGNK